MTWPDDYINKVICGDCLEVMKGIPDGAVDCVVTDPPYGISLDVNRYESAARQSDSLSRNKYIKADWDKVFDFRAIYRPELAKEQFWFGANNFCQQLPSGGSWLVWDRKLPSMAALPGSDFELCWSKIQHRYIMFRILWTGYLATEKNEKRKHPTQKPVALMKAIVSRFSNPDDIIFDPFAGSGTTLVAAKQLGRRYIGIEISQKYCDIANERLRQEELF